MINPSSQNQGTDNELPRQLRDAVERSKGRAPTAESVARLIANVTAGAGVESSKMVESARSPRRRVLQVAGVAALAATLLLMFAVHAYWTRRPNEIAEIPHNKLDVEGRVYSNITRVSFVSTAYPSIEADVLRAEAQIEAVGQRLSLSAIRREVHETLQQYRSWSGAAPTDSANSTAISF